MKFLKVFTWIFLIITIGLLYKGFVDVSEYNRTKDILVEVDAEVVDSYTRMAETSVTDYNTGFSHREMREQRVAVLSYSYDGETYTTKVENCHEKVGTHITLMINPIYPEETVDTTEEHIYLIFGIFCAIITALLFASIRYRSYQEKKVHGEGNKITEIIITEAKIRLVSGIIGAICLGGLAYFYIWAIFNNPGANTIGCICVAISAGLAAFYIVWNEKYMFKVATGQFEIRKESCTGCTKYLSRLIFNDFQVSVSKEQLCFTKKGEQFYVVRCKNTRRGSFCFQVSNHEIDESMLKYYNKYSNETPEV